MVSFKPSLDDRKKKAKEQNKLKVKDIDEICNLLEKALNDKNIVGTILKMKPKEVNYEQIKEKYGTNKSSDIIFIQFTKDGHVAVLGAGKDMSFSKNISGTNTWRIISAIERVEWNDEMVIIIPIRYIKDCKIKKGDSILAYRNGIEQYLGDYLLSKGVPILNCYQHKNYTDKAWNEWKKNDYIIK